MCFDDVFYVFLIPVSNRNQLLTDVLWFKVTLLDVWVLYCLLLLQSSTTVDLWQKTSHVSTANALIWGLLTLFCFLTASKMPHHNELHEKLWYDTRSAAKFSLQLLDLGNWKVWSCYRLIPDQSASCKHVAISWALVTSLLSRHDSVPKGRHKSTYKLEKRFNALQLMIKARVGAVFTEQTEAEEVNKCCCKGW